VDTISKKGATLTLRCTGFPKNPQRLVDRRFVSQNLIEAAQFHLLPGCGLLFWYRVSSRVSMVRSACSFSSFSLRICGTCGQADPILPEPSRSRGFASDFLSSALIFQQIQSGPGKREGDLSMTNGCVFW